MTIVGIILLLIGSINVIISVRNHRAQGINLTRTKFVVYNCGLLIVGLVLIIRGISGY